jgi:predicted transcriptional regulator
MAVFRVSKDKTNPYVMVNKYYIYDKRLSLKAKGLMSYFLSRPDDWEFYVEEMKNHTTDKETSISSAIKELIKMGYIKREAKRNASGKFVGGHDYVVYEVPIDLGSDEVLPDSEFSPIRENPESGKTRTGENPNWENQGLLNNEYKLNNDSCCSSKEILPESYGADPNDSQQIQDEQGTVPNTRPKNEDKGNYGTVPNDCTDLDKVVSCYATKSGMLESNISGKDIASAQRMLAKKMPIEFICNGIKQSFENFKPNYEGDKINSLSYCEKIINKLWANKKAREVKTDGASRPGDGQDRQISKKFRYTQQPIPDYSDEDLERAGIE